MVIFRGFIVESFVLNKYLYIRVRSFIILCCCYFKNMVFRVFERAKEIIEYLYLFLNVLIRSGINYCYLLVM